MVNYSALLLTVKNVDETAECHKWTLTEYKVMIYDCFLWNSVRFYKTII